MKLSSSFITHNYKDEQLMVAVGSKAKDFHGIVRSNPTAAFIIDLLKTETTLDGIVGAMTEEYDVDEATARRDALAVIEKLRSIGAIEQ